MLIAMHDDSGPSRVSHAFNNIGNIALMQQQYSKAKSRSARITWIQYHALITSLVYAQLHYGSPSTAVVG